MPARILIVEDDPIFRSVMRDNLIFEGYRVDAVADGNAALAHVRTFSPDQGGKVPVIILSARGQKVDKIRGLKLGADDYITKPTDLDELLARIRVVLRRSRPTIDRLKVGRLLIDFRASTASSGSASVRLTHREFELLRYLAERRDKVVHRDELLREVWGYLDATVTTRSVDQTIARLRKKIEPDPRRPEFIRTVHGDGYCLSAGEAESKN
jgi:two-component system response regulator VicR